MARVDPKNLTQRLVEHHRSLGLPASAAGSGIEQIAEQVDMENAQAARKEQMKAQKAAPRSKPEKNDNG